MLSKAAPKTDNQPPNTAARHRIVRPLLSPEISELLNMLEAFEKSVAREAAPSRR
jgi:hypothetical protein